MYKPEEAIVFSQRRLRMLEKLVARGEGQGLEFKRKASHPDKIAIEFVAFANAAGGILLVGIEDDGGIHGVKHAEGDSFAIREILKHVKPSIQFEEEFIPISTNRMVIQYTIAESLVKPHYWVDNGTRKAYIRVNDKAMQASKEMCEVLKRASKKTGFKFTFGEQEKLLMQYLEVHKHITLSECAVLLKINTWKASRKLVLLTLADVLKISPTEKGDLYSRC